METVSKSPVMLYTEQTPNPESLKFVTNKMLYKGTADFREAEQALDWSPIANALFDLLISEPNPRIRLNRCGSDRFSK